MFDTYRDHLTINLQMTKSKGLSNKEGLPARKEDSKTQMIKQTWYKV